MVSTNIRLSRFRAGLTGGLIGLIIWGFLILVEVLVGENAGITTGITIGFALMIGSPLFFWAAVPVFSSMRKLLAKKTIRK